MAEDEEVETEDEGVGDEIPQFSIPRIIDTIKTKGPIGAYNDEEMGPHIHLSFLISAIAFIAFIITIVLFIIG